MRVMVITPTTGKDTLDKAIESVKKQTIETEHLVVSDGVYMDHPDGCSFLKLPENVGLITGMATESMLPCHYW